MGQTPKNLAIPFRDRRREMDESRGQPRARPPRAGERRIQQFARRSGAEISPIFDDRGNLYKDDAGVRKDSRRRTWRAQTLFRPEVRQRHRRNSSQITDGATWLVLATEEAVKRHALKPLGRIVDSQWAGLDPAQMGLGPVQRGDSDTQAPPARAQRTSTPGKSTKPSRPRCSLASPPGRKTNIARELGLDGALVSSTRRNSRGRGAIALGHPVGASGARIVLHLVHTLRRAGNAGQRPRRGMASICIGGGLGGAMLVETV